MIFKIAKWGHGAAIRLPANVMESNQWHIGDQLIGRLDEGALTLKAAPKIPVEIRQELTQYLLAVKERSGGGTKIEDVLKELENEIAKLDKEVHGIP